MASTLLMRGNQAGVRLLSIRSPRLLLGSSRARSRLRRKASRSSWRVPPLPFRDALWLAALARESGFIDSRWYRLPDDLFHPSADKWVSDSKQNHLPSVRCVAVEQRAQIFSRQFYRSLRVFTAFEFSKNQRPKCCADFLFRDQPSKDVIAQCREFIRDAHVVFAPHHSLSSKPLPPPHALRVGSWRRPR